MDSHLFLFSIKTKSPNNGIMTLLGGEDMKRKHVLHLGIVLIIIGSVFADYILADEFWFVSLLSVSTGITSGLVYFYNKNYKYSIIITLFLTIPVSRFLLIEEALLQLVVLSIQG